MMDAKPIPCPYQHRGGSIIDKQGRPIVTMDGKAYFLNSGDTTRDLLSAAPELAKYLRRLVYRLSHANAVFVYDTDHYAEETRTINEAQALLKQIEM